MKNLDIPYKVNTTITEQDIYQLEADIGQFVPSVLREFYLTYYSLEFDGNMLFELDNEMDLIQGDEDLEVSVHRLLLYEEIKYVKQSESVKDGYEEFFGDFWKNYIPVASGLGDSGYFLVGSCPSNHDEVIFLSYTDNTVIKVCNDIFEFFNTKLQEY